MADYRYVKFAKATTWGTSVSGSTVMNCIKFDISRSRSTNMGETMGYQEAITNSVGKYKVDVSMDGYFVPDEMCGILQMIFGTSTDASAEASAFTHTYTPDPTQIHYSMEFGEDTLGTGIDNMMTKKLVLKLAPGGDWMYTADLVGRKDVYLAPSSPTFDTDNQPLHHTNTTVSIGGSGNTTVKALEYTFECDTNDDEFTVESQYLKIPHRGMFKTTIKCDVQFDTTNELYRFYDGTTSPDLNAPEDDVAPFNVTTTVTGLACGSGTYGITITTPKVIWDTSKSTIDKRSRTIQNLVGLVKYDSSYGTQFELTNAISDH